MEAKFTPGPWFTSRPHGTIYIEARLRGTTLQEVAAVGPTETANQQEANARLIAAAPELFAIVATFDSYMGQAGEEAEKDSNNPIRSLRWKAQQAIRKATTGEQA